MTTLLLVRHLVLDLDGTGSGLDHLLGQQVGRLGITKAGVDVGDNRHHVGLEVIDLVLQVLGLHFITRLACCIQLAEQAAQFAGICLAQECVELFDQTGHRGFLVHGLVGQRAKFTAQGSNHPARQIQVALIGLAEVLLDSDQLLLADKAVPTTQRLGVLAGICVVLGHVLAHDTRRVASDIQAVLEPILQAHPGRILRIDVAPGGTLLLAQ